MNKIAVIIVTYNGEKWIEKCLKSVIDSSVSTTVFVVDNASTDNIVSILKNFSDVTVEILNENIGFGKANNIGIKNAIKQDFDSFFILNQDTWIEPHTIEKLVLQQNKNTEFGILSPMHFDGSGTALDLNFEKYYSKSIKTNDNLYQTSFVNAAAWLVSKKCVETVGLFEPSFSHYGEDRNYCDRARFHNFKIGIVDDAKIIHDRTIKRSFEKDVLQSKYQIWCALLNINFSSIRCVFVAFLKVFGLPKYFYKHYDLQLTGKMFLKLFVYFIQKFMNLKLRYAIRQQSINGKNGLR